jgi:TPR repeat protein
MRQTIKAGLAVLVLSLGLATPVAAGPSEDAGAAYNRGDYATALRLWLPLAVQGDVFAQFALGFMYDKGRGVPSDGVEAVRWYRKAAEQGDAEAQASLGNMYAAGRGVPQDYAPAVRWYRKAAERSVSASTCTISISGTPQLLKRLTTNSVMG